MITENQIKKFLKKNNLVIRYMAKFTLNDKSGVDWNVWYTTDAWNLDLKNEHIKKYGNDDDFIYPPSGMPVFLLTTENDMRFATEDEALQIMEAEAVSV